MPYGLKFLIITLSVFLLFGCSEKTEPLKSPTTGVYDGRMGSEHLILEIENSNDNNANGYFIFNRNWAVEKAHAFSFNFNEPQATFTSSPFSGEFFGFISDSTIDGTINIKERKFLFFHWNKKKQIHFKIRKKEIPPTSSRYLEPIFKGYTIDEDLIYGKAVGYWTETPYLDDPYIEILARSMINLLKTEKELDLKLDLYRPKGDHHAVRPLVLLVHGGAFYIGNKQAETEQFLARELTSRGYVVASIDYRLGFRFRGYDMERSGYKAIQDVHAALRYLARHAIQYGIDPGHVYVAGTSAGAIASLNVAFLNNDNRPKSTYRIHGDIDLGNIESSGNKYTDLFEIKAVGNMWGALTDTSIISAGTNIPVISFHGSKDDIVPVDHSHPFKNTLRINRMVMDKMYGSIPIHQHLEKLGIENKLVLFEGAGHEPQLDNFKTLNSLMKVISSELIAFFNKQTVPEIILPGGQITIDADKKRKPLDISVKNGELVHIEAKGGFKTSSDPTETSIIWIEGAQSPRITIYAKNKFDALTQKTIKIELK